MALTPFRSQLILDTGISFGDEGKGRLVPEVVEELTNAGKKVSSIAKINGGANSGHTVGGLKLNLIPGGVVCPEVGKLTIGSGVAADPRKFLWECAYINDAGYEAHSRLLIDERVMLSDLTHRLLDLAWEHYRSAILGEEKRGSTGRGISPAFGDETAHYPIYYSDFLGPREAFEAKLKARVDRAEKIIEHVCAVDAATWDSFFDVLTTAEQRANANLIEAKSFTAAEFDFHRFKGDAPYQINFSVLADVYWEAGQALREQIGNVREFSLEALARGEYIIGEFGQAYWLDKRFGFAPNVTASHTIAPEFFLSLGLPIQDVHTFGVCKAYDTKVGTHTFICQMDPEHPLSIKLSQIEFGVSTGRQRMVGWFDALEKGDAIRYGGCQDLMINKIDALSYDADGAWQGGELLICIGYKTPTGEVLKHVPRDPAVHPTLEPVYRQYAGWAEDVSGIRTFDNLPLAAKRYIAGMVLHTYEIAYGEEPQLWPKDVPQLRYIGVGPDPSQIIKDAPKVLELIKLA
jgi:adenylosuccinate synthase|tara:strand:+ start:2520 stop:4073 length:1554 start_codon:yes stop_codon:yes gene_type:complete